MANAKQVMDFRPSKGITTAQSNEHQRRWTEKGWQSAEAKGNYDRSREHLNFEIRQGKVVPVDKRLSIPERMAAMLREQGIKDPNEGLAEPRFRTVVNFIFGGSRERMLELAFGNQTIHLDRTADNSSLVRNPDIEAWAKDVYSFVSGKYGEQNIAAFIVHLDELNPHIHCTLLPIKDGKFAYKQIFAGKDKYEFSARIKQLHNEFAEVNRKWGMSRGTSISETGARHRSTEEYRRQLSEECTAAEQTLETHRHTLAELQAEIRMAERRVKGLTTMVQNLTAKKEQKEQELSKLYADMEMATDHPEILQEKKEKLEQELKAIHDKLDDKQMRLQEANQKLEDLNRDMVSIQDRTEELRNEAVKYSGTIQRGVDTLFKDVLSETLVKDYMQRVDKLPAESRALFDDSLLQDFAERGTEIIHCAMMLFLGYVDDATTFAETHGGGGGSSELKWGRDDDEDNWAWARRCMVMASRMMRPSGGRKVRR